MQKRIGFSAMELTLLGLFGTMLAVIFTQDLLARRAAWLARRRPQDVRWSRV